MYYKNDFKKSVIEGEISEKKFEKILNSRGFKFRKSTPYEDSIYHIDYYACRTHDLKNFDKNALSFDVKSKKRVSRNNKNYSTDFIWIELKNVKGYDGWLYGSQQFIAFEFENYFLIVNRESLLEKVNSLISNAKKVFRSTDALYNLYTRKNRKDCITMITVSDLMDCKHRVWNF